MINKDININEFTNEPKLETRTLTNDNEALTFKAYTLLKAESEAEKANEDSPCGEWELIADNYEQWFIPPIDELKEKYKQIKFMPIVYIAQGEKTIRNILETIILDTETLENVILDTETQDTGITITRSYLKIIDGEQGAYEEHTSYIEITRNRNKETIEVTSHREKIVYYKNHEITNIDIIPHIGTLSDMLRVKTYGLKK